MERNKKEMYLSPEVKTVEVKIVGVVCMSGELELDYVTPFEGEELVW
jgi:hypothetical protein